MMGGNAMKVIRAHFQNFRILRDLTLDFSTDPERKLTVIRAENESGKTTILTALQWALYGDSALPDNGRDYRLHPIDWDVSTSKQIPISVQVDFETTSLRRSSRGVIEAKECYRIVRSTHETLEESGWVRSPSTVKLFRLTNHGNEPITPPEAVIRDVLPPELREVFFTDGDRALSFIEATSVTAKRERVRDAIRSLLGLAVIEKAIDHVKKASAELNKAAKSLDRDGELQEIADQLVQLEETIEKWEAELKEANTEYAGLAVKLHELEDKINVALQHGNREHLATELTETRNRLHNIHNQIDQAAKEHSQLFRGLPFARDLLAPVLRKSFAVLEELYDQGKIPNTTIPVLEERLKHSTCICGESLSGEDPASQRRRANIRLLIEQSRAADELQAKITDLYYGARPLNPDRVDPKDTWRHHYTTIADKRDRLEIERRDLGQKVRALEVKIESLPSTDIRVLTDTRKLFEQRRESLNATIARLKTQLEHYKQESEKLTIRRNALLQEKRRGIHILAQHQLAQDVDRVLRASYDRLTQEELQKVSRMMNDLFLEMIGADPEQGAIVRRAEISEDFDIVVYGPQDRTLNPDQDLNGASRRALTLAFILALTKISEVEAPNIIDTPLGMTSGYVKQSILRTAIRESSQLVLFLTRSEISGCEEILDEYAGRIYTLTNPKHYPVMLLNDPQVDEITVLRCDCDHRSECRVCQRRMKVEPTGEDTLAGRRVS